MNQQQWISRGRQLAKVTSSSSWDLGDWAIEGEQYFGTKTASYDEAQAITGISRGILYRHAMLARHYSKQLRFTSIPFFAYYQLKPFPIEFTSRFLPTVADKDLTCGQILARAIEEYGSDPAPRRKKLAKRHPVYLYSALYNALAERAPDKHSVPAFIQTILEEWLVGATTERQPTSNAKTAEWRRRVVETDAQGSAEASGNESADAQPQPTASTEPESPRPTYAERREQQIAHGAQPIPAKLHRRPVPSTKKRFFNTKLQWTECHGKSYIEGKDGVLSPAGKALRASCIDSEAEANALNEQFAKYYGYKEQVVYCDVCKAWHLKHIYAAEVRVTTEDALQQHAQV
jgi:hypothetical protein